jgi:hypothetical protein
MVRRGGILTTTTGGSPHIVCQDGRALACVFYWDILDRMMAYISDSGDEDESRKLVKVVSSERSLQDIPDEKHETWKTLLMSNAVSYHGIRPGSNSGTLKRIEQERLSDALITIGGGAGVEHLADLYMLSGKPVIPLDIPLGGFYMDGLGGSETLYRKACSDIKRFIPNVDESNASQFIGLRFNHWHNKPIEHGHTVVDFIEEILHPQVFYVRLLNMENPCFNDVEWFFRQCVDEVAYGRDLHIVEMGTSLMRRGFIDVEIIDQLSKSSIIIADLTGVRPNCLFELGYSFGRSKRVILTAKKGTRLPFDTQTIPCYFWNPKHDKERTRDGFNQFWDTYIDRDHLTNI